MDRCIHSPRPVRRVSTSLLLIIALALVLALVQPAVAAPWATPPAPRALGMAPAGTPGTVYIGAIPPGGGTNRPVLVFVQGMHGQASDWWLDSRYYGHNDMYDYAYNYGYRTAFVDLWDAGGTGHSMWDNGSMLRTQLDTIASYYGVSSFNVVAHSKGGIDTQTAIVHYGAYPRVQKVFTLSTPHWGSQTADLCYSTWTWWLAALLGQRDDATYVLQTGYMSWFRSITDNRSENNSVRYYTSGGTNWGPLFSALWFGGSYLGFYGSNDGLVTVTSSRNPRATHVFTRDLNHDNMRIGRYVFSNVDPYVNALWRAGAFNPEQATDQLDAATGNPLARVPAGSILRGGPLAGTAAEAIAVESGATHLTLDVLSNLANLDVAWTAPNGQLFRAEPAARDAGDVFAGAYHYVASVDAPAAGTWRLALTNPGEQDAAYLLVADVASPLQVTLERDAALAFTPGSPLAFTVTTVDAAGRRVTALEASGQLALDGVTQPGTFSFSGRLATLAGQVSLPATTGVANVSVTVRGELSDGSRFERGIVVSVPVVAPGGTLRR